MVFLKDRTEHFSEIAKVVHSGAAFACHCKPSQLATRAVQQLSLNLLTSKDSGTLSVAHSNPLDIRGDPKHHIQFFLHDRHDVNQPLRWRPVTATTRHERAGVFNPIDTTSSAVYVLIGRMSAASQCDQYLAGVEDLNLDDMLGG